MDDVSAAILLAQTLVGAPALNTSAPEERAASADRENLSGREVDNEEAHAVGEHLLQRRDRILARGELGVDDREGLVEEAPGGVVVIQRHAGAGDEVIRGRDIQDRDRFARECAS